MNKQPTNILAVVLASISLALAAGAAAQDPAGTESDVQDHGTFFSLAPDPGLDAHAGMLPVDNPPPNVVLPNVMPLATLLGEADAGAGVMAAQAASEGAGDDVKRERAASGLRFTAGGGYGLVRNIVDTHTAFTYAAAQAQAGLSYPLLGAAEQADRNVDVAVGKQQEAGAKLEGTRRLAKMMLEDSYASYWGAQESLQVVDAYLAVEEPVLSRLRLRAQRRLMLGSELLDAQAGFDQAKADRARLERIRDESRARIERLSGHQLGEFSAQAVSLPATPATVTAAQIERHPDLQALQAKRDAAEAQLKDSAWYGLDAHLDVTGSGVKDTSQGGPNGGTLFAGVVFSAPVSVISVRSNQRKSLRAQMEDLRLQYIQRSQELAADLQSARQQAAQLEQESALAGHRSDAAQEALREGSIRGGAFAEEGLSQLNHRLYAYYTVALNDIDSQVKAWQASADLRGDLDAVGAGAQRPPAPDPSTSPGARLAAPIQQFGQSMGGGRPAATNGPVGMNAPASPHRASFSVVPPRAGLYKAVWQPGRGALLRTGAVPQSGGWAVYVWNSAAAMAQLQHSEHAWTALKAMPVSRLLLGLKAEQIADAKTNPQELRSFLEAAKAHGVTVDLLLGDAGWIDPAQRPKLIEIINKLQGFGFAGLNLDIEPDQAYKQPLQKAQFDNWVATMKAAAQASPWPVSVSVHPRYFRDPPYQSWNLAARLREAGINEAVLMIYNSDPQHVAEVAGPIAAAGGGLRFGVAQSVEPDLGPKLSYAGATPEQFGASMRQLQGLLAAQPNTNGVVVQAWADLMRMGYESQIR